MLIDSEPLWETAEREFIKARGGIYDEAVCRPTMGWSMRDFLRRIKAHYDLAASLEELCLDLTSRIIALMSTRLQPVPGAQALLEATAEKRSCAVASGSPLTVVNHALVHCDWRQHFQAVCSADEVAHGKPAPDLFLYAARRLEAEPSACVVIEDSPAGVRAAREAGMRCIALARAGRVPAAELSPWADRLVSSLTEIDAELLDG